VTISVRVIPRAQKSIIAGRRGDALLVRLAAPPVEGVANRALIELLSRAFQRPRRNISIISGEKSRDKLVAIEGITGAEFNSRLSDILKDAE
jgi:uncharacterized protein (TIGR00251 family)